MRRMTKIDYYKMKCDCKKSECPVFNKCCYLPTECHPDKEGNIELLFVGQGGGADERKRGRPFIGRAGQRLRNQIVSMMKHLNRHVGVAFSNTIRDNPDGNRVPSQEELDFCLEYLYKDIFLLMKRGLKVVIPLGNAAKKALLPDSGAMGGDHGTLFSLKKEKFGEIAVIPTYHPSYVMRNFPRFNGEKLSSLDHTVITDMCKAYWVGEINKTEKILDLDSELDVTI